MTDTLIRLSSPTLVTESGNGTTGWNYIGTTTGNFSVYNGGIGDSNLAADGDFRATVGTWNGDYGFCLGLDETGAVTTISEFEFGIYFNSNTQYKVIENGTPTAAVTNTVVPAVGDVVRLSRTGSDVSAEVSKNGGSSWTVVKALSNTSSASLRPVLMLTTEARADAIQFTTGGGGATISTITGTTVTEASSVVFTATMSGTGGGTFAYSWAGTATSADYTSTLTTGMCAVTGGSGSVTVSGSNITVDSTVTAFTVTVPTTTDTLDEANETIRLVIGGVTSSSGTINDDDAAPTITGTASSTVTAGDPVVITYSPGLSGQTRTYTLALTDGTATGGTDYDNTTVTGDFAVTAGTGSVSISGSTVTVDAGVTEFTLTITTTA